MKKLLIPALLLAAASSYGATLPAGLTAAASDPGRLADYTNWFAPQFSVASDANYVGVPYPRIPAIGGTPSSTSMDTVNRDWSGWQPNWTPGLVGPILGTAVTPAQPKPLNVQFAFLGETAGWWDDIGYRYNGVDYLLADGVQAVGGLTRTFGDYAYFTLDAGDTLDFFITGSEKTGKDGVITTGGVRGGKYYMFDKSLNTPAGAINQSYFGTLMPLTSVRGPEFLGNVDGAIPFQVVAFEDINLRSNSDRDYNDVLFAVQVGNGLPQGPVPEPSTYGLIGAAALLALVGYRRFKKA